MLKKVATVLLATLSAASIAAVNAPSASAATYTELKFASKLLTSAHLWLNDQTRAIHAEGRVLRPGWIVRLDIGEGYPGRKSITATATRATASLSTRPHRENYTSYSACAGDPVLNGPFVCTRFHYHRT
jgi:hypothetical protein